MNKPYSESCDQNQEHILRVIQPLLKDKQHLLEIGSGTGQHAVYFAQKMPHLTWHTSDCVEYLPSINLWLDDADLENTRKPFELNVSNKTWPNLTVNTIFTANSLHIMNQDNVVDLFSGIGSLLNINGEVLVYGPFNYNNNYTSESNAKFDDWLKAKNVGSCIKNFETVCHLAENNGLSLVNDYEMPANNRILHWIKR